jgi:hypothetical protein
MSEHKYSKWTVEGDKKHNGYADVSKQLMVISNSVINTILHYKKQFKLKLMS